MVALGGAETRALPVSTFRAYHQLYSKHTWPCTFTPGKQAAASSTLREPVPTRTDKAFTLITPSKDVCTKVSVVANIRS
jgi:hypothetical protein